jgi:Tannase and feruloyl esterase
MGQGTADKFLKLYTAPGVDHVGSGAPANVDVLPALVNWVERGSAPTGLQIVDQEVKAPFTVTRARPLCEWPRWTRYVSGDVNLAASFTCEK